MASLHSQLKELRAEWRWWRSGRLVVENWWGVPWCEDAANGRCSDDQCEGAWAVLYSFDRAAEIAAKAEALKAQAAQAAIERAVRKRARVAQQLW